MVFTEEEIGAWKDLAIVLTLRAEWLRESEYRLTIAVRRAFRVAGAHPRLMRLAQAGYRRNRMAAAADAEVGAIVRHVHAIESGEDPS